MRGRCFHSSLPIRTGYLQLQDGCFDAVSVESAAHIVLLKLSVDDQMPIKFDLGHSKSRSAPRTRPRMLSDGEVGVTNQLPNSCMNAQDSKTHAIAFGETIDRQERTAHLPTSLSNAADTPRAAVGSLDCTRGLAAPSSLAASATPFADGSAS
jgi:hypothetical protein